MAPDRRRMDRSASWVEASCDIRGRACRARISDVSHDGCRAVMGSGTIAPGDRVVIKLTDLLVLPATVVWYREGQTGLQFASPMLGAMLSQFILRFGQFDRLQ